MSTFWSSALCLMPTQLRERVGKWTHEPRSDLNHKKHLSNAFMDSFIFPKIQKHIYFLAHTTKTQKHHYRIIFTLLHCYLLYCICYHISFYLLLHLVLDNHSVELGTQDKEIVLQVAWIRMSGAFSTVPWEFVIKTMSSLVGKIYSCYNTPHLESWRVGTFS
jgi:hypothetical protein